MYYWQNCVFCSENFKEVVLESCRSSVNSSVIARVLTRRCRCSGERRILMECCLFTSFHLMNIFSDYRQNKEHEGESKDYR